MKKIIIGTVALIIIIIGLLIALDFYGSYYFKKCNSEYDDMFFESFAAECGRNPDGTLRKCELPAAKRKLLDDKMEKCLDNFKKIKQPLSIIIYYLGD